MSNSLNRISLDLVNLEADMKHAKKKKKNNRSKSVLDLIPANYKIVKSNGKSESFIASRQYHKIGVLKDKKRFVQNKVLTEENIHRLLLLSNNRIDMNITDKLFNRAVEKRPVLQEYQLKEEEKTAFTEEDFNKFAREYCNN